ncbi:MAG: YesL family protein [Clostridia bacterium]|nr:YesL family protein [Clostridia bacterium]
MAKRYENMSDNQSQLPELKKKSFNPFEFIYNRDGKGVEKEEFSVLEKPGIANFFKLFWRRFNQIFGVNLLLVFGNFPVFFFLIGMAYTTLDATAPSRQIYSALEAVSRFDNSPVVSTFLGAFGGQDSVSVPTIATYILFALTALVFVTFGPVNAGTTYILRNALRGEPVFVWSDFWYAVKRNFKQALIFGVIDILMIVMLIYDFVTYRNNIDTNIGMFMFVLCFGISIFYYFIRMYIYPMMVTFDMSILKLIKNGMLFAILGIKRNIMVLLGTIAVIIIQLLLLGVVMPVAVMLPVLITFGLLGYMCIYGAYPKIKEIMIDPYYKEESVEQ